MPLRPSAPARSTRRVALTTARLAVLALVLVAGGACGTDNGGTIDGGNTGTAPLRPGASPATSAP